MAIVIVTKVKAWVKRQRELLAKRVSSKGTTTKAAVAVKTTDTSSIEKKDADARDSAVVVVDTTTGLTAEPMETAPVLEEKKRSERESSPNRAYGSVRRKEPAKGTVVVVSHAFEARSSEHLDLALGDKVLITRSFNDGWLCGEIKEKGVSGLFPSHCVENPDEKAPVGVEPGDEGSGWYQVAGIWVKAENM